MSPLSCAGYQIRTSKCTKYYVCHEICTLRFRKGHEICTSRSGVPATKLGLADSQSAASATLRTSIRFTMNSACHENCTSSTAQLLPIETKSAPQGQQSAAAAIKSPLQGSQNCLDICTSRFTKRCDCLKILHVKIAITQPCQCVSQQKCIVHIQVPDAKVKLSCDTFPKF